MDIGKGERKMVKDSELNSVKRAYRCFDWPRIRGKGGIASICCNTLSFKAIDDTNSNSGTVNYAIVGAAPFHDVV